MNSRAAGADCTLNGEHRKQIGSKSNGEGGHENAPTRELPAVRAPPGQILVSTLPCHLWNDAFIFAVVESAPSRHGNVSCTELDGYPPRLHLQGTYPNTVQCATTTNVMFKGFFRVKYWDMEAKSREHTTHKVGISYL